MRLALVLAGLFTTVFGAGLATAAAQADPDDDALALADRAASAPAPPPSSQARPALHVFSEAGVERESSVATVQSAVLGIDLRGHLPGPAGWRLEFSDRLDVAEPLDGPGGRRGSNALRELYVSGTLTQQWLVTLGRQNIRNGVAQGYSPSDFFKPHALRSVLSHDPGELRANRLGVVAARTDWFGDADATSLLLAPRLHDNDAAGALKPRFGATNTEAQALLTWTHRLTDDLKPQAAVYLREGQSPQWALQATTLLSRQLVAYAEWSGGRARTLAQEALSLPAPSAFRQRATLGATWTSPHKLSLTGEYSRNGAGLDAGGWRQLQSLGPAAVEAVLLRARDLQDPPSRDTLYWQARWQDAPVDRIDLAAYLRQSLAEHSHEAWMELRYRAASHDEFDLQWLADGGPTGSVYGSRPLHVWTLVWRHDFR